MVIKNIQEVGKIMKFHDMVLFMREKCYIQFFFKHNLKEGFGTTFQEEQNFTLLGKWEKDLIEGSAILINLSKNNANGILDIHKEIIVCITKGEITKMNLEEDELNKFKNSKDYNELIKLYKEKYFLDYIKYKNEKDDDQFFEFL